MVKKKPRAYNLRFAVHRLKLKAREPRRLYDDYDYQCFQNLCHAINIAD
jgi:hypothetical protein